MAMGLIFVDEGGAKELGAAQLLNLLYLNFNAAKAAATQPPFKNLNFPEVVIACICIDFTAAGLQMTTSDKGTLSARLFVKLSAANQLVGLLMMILMLSSIPSNFKDMSHTYIVWWGRVDSLTGPSSATWIYIAIRALILCHGIWLDFKNTDDFDRLKKDWTALAPGDQRLEKRKHALSDYHWASLSATVFSKWIELIPSVIVGIYSIEDLSRRLPKSGSITDWGQSATLVLAIAGALNCLYVMRIPLLRLRDRDTGLESDQLLKYPIDCPRYDPSWDPKDGHWDQMLLSSARNGILKGVRRALNNGAGVNVVDLEGETALLYAIMESKRDKGEMYTEIMEFRPDPLLSGVKPAICVAAQYGTLEVVDDLLQHSKAVSWQRGQTGCKAVVLAAGAGEERNLRRILQAWTDNAARSSGTVWHFQDEVDSCGETALTLATKGHHWSCAKILLDNLLEHREFRRIITALLLPQRWKEGQESAFVIDNSLGSDSFVKGTKTTFLHLAIEHERTWNVEIIGVANIIRTCKRSVDCPDGEGRTPLLLAVERNNSTCVRELLRQGADMTIKDRKSRSAFSLIFQSGKTELWTEIQSGLLRGDTSFLKNLPVAELEWLFARDLISAHLICDHIPLLYQAISRNLKTLVRVLTSKFKKFPRYGRYKDPMYPGGEQLDWRSLAELTLSAVDEWEYFHGDSYLEAWDVLVESLEKYDDSEPRVLERIRKVLEQRLGPDPFQQK
ncbi:ankyrin repeat domain-containing [Lecanosticta acicola]|uniref:Ankyrin repeat domain-containing n=1 Tax=Lecanosticta acicola TaxID=111012 RepID=A0AAI8YTA3_9PEZI|nr:ankyrin repeat domain-containing [Lecanosticta acicola]